MKCFLFVMLFITSNLLLGACANRGYYLSQQMRGYDNNLNPVPTNSTYVVSDDGQITFTNERAPANE